MRRLFSLFFLLWAVLAGAQTRNYADNASGTFVFGLDSYFYGDAGSLEFDTHGKTFQVSISPDEVRVGNKRLGQGGDVVVGVHDFTGDRQPELVLAHRHPHTGAILVTIYALNGGSWEPVGQMSVRDTKEVRVFRQVVSARCGEALYSWTWHGTRFDFKASDGSAEPSLP